MTIKAITWFPSRFCFMKDFSFASAFLISLINVIFQYEPEGWLPYNYLLFRNLEENLVAYSLYVLIGLLDHKRPAGNGENRETSKIVVKGTSFDDVFNPGADYTSPFRPELQRNVFATIFSQLYRKLDLDFVFSGFIRLMNNPLRASSTYLPGSVKTFSCYEELLMLFWLFLNNNKVG
jgi:hypothetical protein